MEWLKDMCERVRNAEHGPGGDCLKEAFDVMDTVESCDRDGESDNVFNLIQMLIDRVNEMQAVVARLPKTADGVPVEEGMKVFRMDRFDVCRRYEIGGPMIFRDMSRVLYAVSTFYSTEEAAKAASLKDGEE